MILADLNENITVPGPFEEASLSLPPNSIATKNGRWSPNWHFYFLIFWQCDNKSSIEVRRIAMTTSSSLHDKQDE